MTNLEARLARLNDKPYIAPGVKSDYFSCWNAIIPGISKPFVATFSFEKEVFINQVLFVQTTNWSLLGDMTDSYLKGTYATQWDIYVGSDPDWQKNTKCNSEPHLAEDYNDHQFVGELDGKRGPAYGFTDFCNAPGLYVHFVTYKVP